MILNEIKLFVARIGLNKINMAQRFQSDYESFHKLLESAKRIVVLSGAGVSAESGIGTFRGPSGLWRNHKAVDLATLQAFTENPSLVWEFYHWRRQVVFKAQPNQAHLALAQFEQICEKQGRNCSIITQNVDGLHQKAGSTKVIEMHGALNKVRCTKCKTVTINVKDPICEALRGKGDPTISDTISNIPIQDLPSCEKCGSLVRPHIVWFGENLEEEVLQQCFDLVDSCDLFLIIGTSSVVYPAAMFGPTVAANGKVVAEFNIEDEPASQLYQYYFQGQCGTTLSKALGSKV